MGEAVRLAIEAKVSDKAHLGELFARGVVVDRATKSLVSKRSYKQVSDSEAKRV